MSNVVTLNDYSEGESEVWFYDCGNCEEFYGCYPDRCNGTR